MPNRRMHLRDWRCRRYHCCWTTGHPQTGPLQRNFKQHEQTTCSKDRTPKDLRWVLRRDVECIHHTVGNVHAWYTTDWCWKSAAPVSMLWRAPRWRDAILKGHPNAVSGTEASLLEVVKKLAVIPVPRVVRRNEVLKLKAGSWWEHTLVRRTNPG